MTAKNYPFIVVTNKCPVCEQEVTNRYLKSKMYSPQETEDDHFVRKYKWEMEPYKNLRPEYYFIWHCPNCFYSDEKEIFRGEDKMNGKLDILQEKLLIEAKRPDSILSRLSGLIDTQNDLVSWSSALTSHILAVVIHNLLSPNMRIPGKLAKMYLRISWLFRERKYPDISSNIMPDPELTFIIEELKETIPDGPFTEETAMDGAINYYKSELENAGRHDNLRQEVSIMYLLVSLYSRLNRKKDALSYVRIIFQSCTKKRSSTQKALEGAANRKKISAKQIETVKTMLSWLNNTIERTVTLSEKLTEEIFREEYPSARELVLKLETPTPETILEALRKAGFHESTCRKVSDIFKHNMISCDLNGLDNAKTGKGAAAEQKQNKPQGFFAKLVNIIKGD